MVTYLKSAQAQIKADGDDGIVEAIVATYDVDSIGDEIVPGAFAKSLDEWEASGAPIPFIWSHLHDDIDAYLGDVLEAKETDDGLYVKAQIDMDDAKSAKAFRLLKGGRVRNYSFAYDVRDAGPSDDDDSVTQLRELGLYEVGPTLIGMNRETRTLAAKTLTSASAALKVGRVLSAANEKDIREASRLLVGVLSKLGSDDDESEADDDEDNSQSGDPSKRDDSVTSKRDETTRADPDDDLAAYLSLTESEGEI